MSHSYLSQIENGDRNASVGILTKIAEALGVSKLYLFKVAGYLDETDILSLVDENKRLREALESITNIELDRLATDVWDEAASMKKTARRALEGM